MNTNQRIAGSIVLLALLSTINSPLSTAHAQGTAFTYQGRLNDGPNPANGSYDLIFRLIDGANNLVATEFTNKATAVSNGLFAVTLDFGPNAINFNGQPRWLDIQVRTNGSGVFTLLSPRQQLSAAPYAIMAGSASNLLGALPSTQLSGKVPLTQLPDQVVTNNATGLNLTGTFTGNGANVTNVDAATLNGLNATNFWQVGGNNVSSGQFIGSTNNQALELKVNGLRALRIEPDLEAMAPNIVGGTGGNTISTYGSMIAGGSYNAIQTNAPYSAVINGFYNVIQTNAVYSFIGNGYANTVQSNAQVSFVGGGIRNTILADAWQSFIGGGYQNTNGGPYSVVPGGFMNAALGTSSFAAGYRAKALHSGSFVWADTQNADFNSTAFGQFLIRAAGGVGINTNNPQSALHVNGTVTATNFVGSGAGLTGLNAGSLASGTIPLAQLPGAVVTNNETGVSLTGTFTGNGAGLTSLDASKLASGTVADSRLSANAALLNNSQTFTGAKAFNNAANSYLGAVTATTLKMNTCTNTGSYSVAFGDHTTAGGSASAALGFQTTASGTYSTAMGVQTYATGWGATALGQGSVASGGDATALGSYANASADYSTAMGRGTTASGPVAIAMGSNTLASGYGSFAVGLDAKATNWAAVALGAEAIAGGYASVAIGYEAIATNWGATALGRAAVANGADSVALGTATASGDFSIAFGAATASGAFSTAGGAFSIASGESAFVGGGGYDGSTYSGNTASGAGSVVVGGTQNIAGGSRSTVGGGHNNSATNFYATVPGGAWNLAGGQGSFAAGRAAKAVQDGTFVWNDNSSGDLLSTTANSVSMRASGGYRLYSGLLSGVSLAAGGGSWTSLSDRNAKEHIAAINSSEVLAKVAALPLATWNYKSQDAAIRHIGPMAQDFKAAFAVGETDTGISTVDADGVALAAIQGLNQKLEQKETEITELKARLEKLEQFINARIGGAK